MTMDHNSIAIIGMACRFPGASSLEQFWKILHDGEETLTRYSDEQLREAGVSDERIADPRYVKAGQTIDGIDLFDSELFQFSDDEAEILDPQHRLFLECSLEALERSGYDPDLTEGDIGVYAGAGMNTYLLNNLIGRYQSGNAVEHYRLMLANDKDFLATRVSYKLNLQGPSISINTACSTSLVAVHSACLGLISGECEMALAGAVHLGLSNVGYQYQEGMIFSPDGHCRAFDSEARGTVIGSGVGVVILKRLEQAIEDGDWIHAVIRGSAINNDGSDKTGFTAPSVSGQAAAIADALEVSGVEPDSIGYVEAHGTATLLGDPIEVAALTNAFRRGTDRKKFCALGSVKTNIGHLDTAAGIAGLIKTALMLEHKMLVPSLHFRSANPEIDFAASPFFVSTQTTEWSAGNEKSRRAGVSSFGIGGTNAHVVLEEPPTRQSGVDTRECELIVLSARSETALEKATATLARRLKRDPDLDLGAVAQTLSLGRRGYSHRLSLVAQSTRDAAMALALGDDDRIFKGVVARKVSAPVLVLMGESVAQEQSETLYQSVPQYRAAVDACGKVLGRQAGEICDLFGNESVYASFVHEYGLVFTLIEWGVRPVGLAASGSGLAVAAAISESLSLEDSLRLLGASIPKSTKIPRIPVLSVRTGKWMTESESCSVKSWTGVADLTQIDALVANTGRHLVRLTLGDKTSSALNHLLAIAGEQWVLGCPLDFESMYAGQKSCRVPLPPVPLVRRRHWIDPEVESSSKPLNSSGSLRLLLDASDESKKIESLTKYMVEEVSKVLGEHQPIQINSNLFDLGLDSLVLIGIAAKLGAELEFDVPASSFVEFPTIRTFVDNLAELMGLSTSGVTTQNAPSIRVSRRAQRAAAKRGG